MSQAKPAEILARGTSAGVFSGARTAAPKAVGLPAELQARMNRELQGEGLGFLQKLPDAAATVAFLDPQYRGVYDKLQYGNEATSRNNVRVALPQMDEDTISSFIAEISRALIPSGHLFLWMDKFHLCSGFRRWTEGTPLQVVDMLTWDKGKIGLGYRTRHRSEFCVILQKAPVRAKGVWVSRDIPDVWCEPKIKGHPHTKPVELQRRLIAAVSGTDDLVIDPAAGSFSVLKACLLAERNFLGCDLRAGAEAKTGSLLEECPQACASEAEGG